jgi:hypothetical protein
MRAAPEREVVQWLDEQPAESIWITSISLFETRFGLALLPKGRRRQTLEQAFASLLAEDLDHRVLELDRAAAEEAADLAAARRRAGRTVELRDTLIAGIALSRRATIATRNVRDFRDLRVRVIDPWSKTAG